MPHITLLNVLPPSFLFLEDDVFAKESFEGYIGEAHTGNVILFCSSNEWYLERNRPVYFSVHTVCVAKVGWTSAFCRHCI